MKRVYFHIVDPSLGTKFHPIYQYDYIPLAQGLKEMGYEIYSNRNYWKGLDNDYLFKNNSIITPFDCSINVFSGLCEHYNFSFDEKLFSEKKIKKILIDQNDGFFTPLFSSFSRKFDIILHKKNKKITYPPNCLSSWAFGLSNEIVTIANKYQTNFERRKRELLCNFRYGHTVRNYASNYLRQLQLPYPINDKVDQFDFEEYNTTIYADMLKSNGGRHKPNYMKLLSESQICATFGGFFFFANILDKNLFTYRLGNYLLADRAKGRVVDWIRLSKLYFKKTSQIYQWDSWRFWESHVCKCLNLNFDLSYYGVELPVMPENGVHYIGLNFDKSKNYNKSLLNINEMEMKKIAEEGYNWAIQNYTPLPIAKRFFEIIQP